MNNLYGQAGFENVTAELKINLKSLRKEFDETDENYPHIQRIIDENWNK
jgi:hypothetical protein